MITYQDYLKIGDTEQDKIAFVSSVIQNHKHSDFYDVAEIAEDYACHRNRTIIEYQKILYDVNGTTIPDNYSANYKLASNFFGRFVTDQVQYLLGNGATWQSDSTSAKLGKDFDAKLQRCARHALIEGVAYGFWNYDHLEVFKATEFAPLYDETNGSIRAGVRFWQIDGTKPLRATFYEEDGYTDYIWSDGEGNLLKDKNGNEIQKRAYKVTLIASEADIKDGAVIYDGENYPTFPIVPLWANEAHQSEIVGLREQIDAYDLIKSGYANTIDEASFIYWAISNAGGMDDIDISEFMNRLRTLRAAVTTDFNATAEPHQIEAPYQGRGELLDRLRADLYEDFMALDTKNLANGAVTATQIEAAYEPVNSKADLFEFCVLDFIDHILEIAGIEDEATFTRSQIMNRTEEIQALLQAAQYLQPDYVTQKLLTILGDGDKYEEMQAEIDAEEIEQIIPDLDEEEV